jgi:hypothetical protein
MRSKLTFPVLVVASLFGATTLASAQTEQAAGASAESNANAMASTRHHRTHHHYSHHMGYSRAQMDKSRPGGLPVSRKAPD